MDDHRKYIRRWLIRSRAVAFVGAVLFLPVVFMRDVFTGFYGGILALFGLTLILVGVLDGFGVFNRKKLRQAYEQLKSENTKQVGK